MWNIHVEHTNQKHEEAPRTAKDVQTSPLGLRKNQVVLHEPIALERRRHAKILVDENIDFVPDPVPIDQDLASPLLTVLNKCATPQQLKQRRRSNKTISPSPWHIIDKHTTSTNNKQTGTHTHTLYTYTYRPHDDQYASIYRYIYTCICIDIHIHLHIHIYMFLVLAAQIPAHRALQLRIANAQEACRAQPFAEDAARLNNMYESTLVVNPFHSK